MASRSRKSGAVDLAPAGRWIFLIGVVVSLLGGIFVALPSSTDPNVQTYLLYLLIALGLVGGFLHIRQEDEHHFILLTLGLAIFYQPLSVIPGDIAGSTVGGLISSMLQMFGLYLGMAVIAIVVRNVIDWFRS